MESLLVGEKERWILRILPTNDDGLFLSACSLGNMEVRLVFAGSNQDFIASLA